MKKSQQGAALAVSLIILLVLTLIVVSSNQSTVLQEKMSYALKEGHVTLSLAESGIAEAEAYIESLANLDDFNNTNGLYEQGTSPGDFYDETTWDNSQSVDIDVPDEEPATVNYIIQSLGEGGSAVSDIGSLMIKGYGEMTEPVGSNLFRVIARSKRASGAERIVIAYYGKSF